MACRCSLLSPTPASDVLPYPIFFPPVSLHLWWDVNLHCIGVCFPKWESLTVLEEDPVECDSGSSLHIMSTGLVNDTFLGNTPCIPSFLNVNDLQKQGFSGSNIAILLEFLRYFIQISVLPVLLLLSVYWSIYYTQESNNVRGYFSFVFESLEPNIIFLC